MKRKGLSLLLILGMVFVFAGVSMANVPPPPANQLLGFPDVEFDGLTAAECIVCHPNMVDGHHVLYGSAIPQGLCSYANGTCSEDGVTPCVEDTDCTGTCDPVTPGSCLSSADCTQPIPQCNIGGQACPVGLCDDGLTSCQIDGDCAVGESCNAAPCAQPWTGQFCGDPVCYGQSAVVDTDTDSSGTPDTNYSCLSCHEQDNSGGVISFVVERDCVVCHVQGLNQPTVHHADELGAAKNAQCVVCHGDFVDDALGCAETTQNVCSIQSDGIDILCEVDAECSALGLGTCVSAGGCDHDTPTYAPSMVTPDPSTFALICTGAWGGSGTSCTDNADCTVPGETCQAAGPALPGGCNYCHDAGTDTASGFDVHDNYDTHHHSGVYKNRLGGSNDDICLWCHPTGHPSHSSCSNDRSIEDCVTDADCPAGGVCEFPDDPGRAMRGCEVCHGYESLHNIQADSPNAANPGTIVVGGEDAYYGHIGRDNPVDPDNDSDCWGCHAFSISSAPGTSAVIPSLGSCDKDSIIAGVATTVTLVGEALTNGAYTSDCEVVTKAGDVVATVAPSSITAGAMTCNLPALDAGNYLLRAKKDNVVSNPVAVKCVPGLEITDVACEGGILTVTGSGFGEEAPEGAEEFINVKMGTNALTVISWTDTEIQAATDACGGSVTVNGLFGAASTGCDGNFDADEDVDGSDLAVFKIDFGRNGWNNPCEAGAACNGDFDCDGDVDGTDVVGIKADFGRNVWNNACPQETAAECSY